MHKKIALVLNVLSALAAFIAAGLWFWSTQVTVEYRKTKKNEDWTGVSVNYGDGREIDPFATGLAQAHWNRYAAIAAGFAAFLQGAANLVSQ